MESGARLQLINPLLPPNSEIGFFRSLSSICKSRAFKRTKFDNRACGSYGSREENSPARTNSIFSKMHGSPGVEQCAGYHGKLRNLDIK